MTFLSPLLFVGIAAFVGYLSTMKTDTKRVAIHDETGLFVNEFKALNSKDGEYKYYDLSQIDVQFLKDSITNESYEGLLYIPKVTHPKELENNNITKNQHEGTTDATKAEFFTELEELYSD